MYISFFYTEGLTYIRFCMCLVDIQKKFNLVCGGMTYKRYGDSMCAFNLFCMWWYDIQKKYCELVHRLKILLCMDGHKVLKKVDKKTRIYIGKDKTHISLSGGKLYYALKCVFIFIILLTQAKNVKIL